ncbi:MAG: DUF2333 family protein [Pseudomonadota bacterium]
MLDPIIAFFQSVFAAIGKGIGYVIGVLLWPFLAFGRWYKARSWLVRVPVAIVVLIIIAGYLHLIWITQVWSGFDRTVATNYAPSRAAVASVSQPGQPVTAQATQPVGQTDGGADQTPGSDVGGNSCAPSQIALAVADLIDFNVNQNSWVSSQPLYKMGLFFVADWKDTPFFDNKASFQLGINQVTRRTAIELVDRLGRVRGTSSINSRLQDARTFANYNEDAWTLTISPPFIQPSTQSRLRDARTAFLAFNEELVSCEADFDARADNLLQFIDRITADVGSTSEILQRQMQQSNFMGFDRRADDRFWFTYGQLYAYHSVLSGVRSDFAQVFDQRNLEALWTRIDDQLTDALRVSPPIVANGSPSSLIKSHLESIGFDLLRVRSNLVEIRDVLDR